MTLVEFLLARIAQDEGLARTVWPERYTDRMLAECEAKRRIIEMVPELLGVLCALALPYAGHPDYREEWRL